MNMLPLKSWATPLVIGAFTISAVTGLLIFFDLEIGIIEPVHKWLSWLLFIGVLLHALSNWKQVTGYLSQKTGIGVISAALLLTITSLLPIYGHEEKEHGKENQGKIALQALESTSLENLALVIKTTPRHLVRILDKHGVVVNDTSLSIREIAKSNGKVDKELLSVLLRPLKTTDTNTTDHD